MPRGLDVELLREGLARQVALGGDFNYQIGGYQYAGLSVVEVTDLLNTELQPLGYGAVLLVEGTGSELYETGDAPMLDTGQPDARVAVFFCQPLPA